VILSETHSRRVIAEYATSYFNTARPHQGIEQQIPVRAGSTTVRVPASIAGIRVLGGCIRSASRVPDGGIRLA
jgi:hypothetical protein